MNYSGIFVLIVLINFNQKQKAGKWLIEYFCFLENFKNNTIKTWWKTKWALLNRGFDTQEFVIFFREFFGVCFIKTHGVFRDIIHNEIQIKWDLKNIGKNACFQDHLIYKATTKMQFFSDFSELWWPNNTSDLFIGDVCSCHSDKAFSR